MRCFLLPCSSCHVSKWVPGVVSVLRTSLPFLLTTSSTTDALDQNVLYVLLWSVKRLFADPLMPVSAKSKGWGISGIIRSGVLLAAISFRRILSYIFFLNTEDSFFTLICSDINHVFVTYGKYLYRSHE